MSVDRLLEDKPGGIFVFVFFEKGCLGMALLGAVLFSFLHYLSCILWLFIGRTRWTYPRVILHFDITYGDSSEKLLLWVLYVWRR